MKKFVLFALLLIALVAVACAPAPTATPVPPTKAPEPTKAPAPTTAPTVAPTVVPATKAPEPTKAPEATKPPAATVAPTTAAAAATATTAPMKCDKLPNAPTVKAGDLGSKEKPIVITFVPSGDTARIAKAGNDIGDCLNKMTGLVFEKVQVGTSFAASIEAMGANKAQVGFLNTFSVLLAREKYQIEPILAVLRKYNTNSIDPDKADSGKLLPYYKGQFITKKDSGIKTYADLKGKTFCFVDPNSTSGYIIPRIILLANGINPDKDLKAVVNAGSHNNVGLGVYKGDCDAGVSYVDVMTDPAANLAKTFPDIADKVIPFAITDRIPSDGVQVVKGLDPAVRSAIADGLVAMSKDAGGNAVLRGLYTIDGFDKIDIKFYDDFLAVLKKAGIDPASLVK